MKPLEHDETSHGPAGLAIQIEVRNEEELREALSAGAESVLLDNMSPEEARHCRIDRAEHSSILHRLRFLAESLCRTRAPMHSPVRIIFPLARLRIQPVPRM